MPSYTSDSVGRKGGGVVCFGKACWYPASTLDLLAAVQAPGIRAAVAVDPSF